jgi:hypothetical protein
MIKTADEIRAEIESGAAILPLLISHTSRGNTKVPYPIWNFGAAHTCESRRLGLCPIALAADARRAAGLPAFDCYALKSEIAYPACRPFRERQGVISDYASGADIAAGMLTIARNAHHRILAARLSEAADFRSQRDVETAEESAAVLRAAGMILYTYTARQDLDFSACRSLVVNGSGFSPRLANGRRGNTFAAEISPSGNCVCRGDCRRCRLCLSPRGRVIKVRAH